MKKLTAVAFCCLFYLFATADTFIVTSNADSGPGTLREAITLAAANGTSTVDLIRFNLPQQAFNQRIINLVTELPSLTSNLTIDGTTQPGDAYAVTNAKVCIKKNEYAPTFTLLRIDSAQNVKIYGLYLYYGYWQGFFGMPFRSYALYGIDLRNSSDIEIGAEGKGNVINGVVHGIYSNSDSCRNVVIKGNYIGQGKYYEDPRKDIDEVVLEAESCITLAQVKNITIGGDKPGDGNVFGSSDRAINIDTKYSTGNGFILIRNNLIGRKFDRKTPVDVFDFWDAYVTIGRSRNNPANWTSEHLIDYKIIFLDNDIPNHARFTQISDSIIVQRNHFEEDFRSGNGGGGAKLSIGYSPKGGIIGGDDESNANYFFKMRGRSYLSSISIYRSGPFTVLKNVFECNSMVSSTTSISHYNNEVPFAQVDLQTTNAVSGRATPNTRVDLYYDDDCSGCEGRRYLARVNADAAGQWKFTGLLQGTVIATATTKAGYTSEFSRPMFNLDSVKIVNPTCGKKNGSIRNIKTEGAETFFWVRYQYPNEPDTVSHSLDLVDAGPGEYILFGVRGGTCVNNIYRSYVLDDYSPKVEMFWTNVTQPSCGRFNGSISGLSVRAGLYATTRWINQQGQTIGTDLSLNNLGPGTYRFIVTDTTLTGGCADTASFVLINQSGPSLLTTNMLIKNAVCGQNGSITQLSYSNAQGSPFIRWTDTLNNTMSTKLDLVNVPPGKYRLLFKDAGACDTIITPYYVVGNTGAITIDTVGKKIAPAKCSGGGGSIQDIGVTGGVGFQWKNTVTNAVVATSLNALNLPAGSYQLTVNNQQGCTQISPVVTIPQAAFLPIVVLSSRSVPATCGQANGFVETKVFSRDTSLYSFRWVDSATGRVVSHFTNLYQIDNGHYQLFARDSNGCEQKIMDAPMFATPVPSFDYTGIRVTPDQCASGIGAIEGMVVRDLANGNISYAWLNENGDSIGRSLTIRNLPQGRYRLRLNNVGCVVESQALVVNNVNVTLPAPQYDEQTILKNTTTVLTVKNPQAGTYQLFDGPAGTTPLQQNTTGIFTTPALAADQQFFVRFINGVCSSALAGVWVKVVDKNTVYVPTAFSPNGDGKNDVLKAIPVGKVKLIQFTVFNRWGEVVFSTTNFSKGWNGTRLGVPAETGVYVWVLKAADELKGAPIEQKGTVTIVR